VVFTDDDCTATPEWLDALAAYVSAAPDAMVGGRTLNALPHDRYAAASQAMTDAVYAYFNAETQGARFFPSNNMTLPIAGFEDIGGFDVSFPLAASEDRELCDRWLHAGRRMIYAPDVIVHHAHALTWQRFWRQHFNYGRGDCHFHHVKAQHGRGSVPMESGFFVHLFRYPFTHSRGREAFRLESLFVMAYAAKTLGFFWEKASSRIRQSCVPKSRTSAPF
jgi:GT2 family glycosyltransferase